MSDRKRRASSGRSYSYAHEDILDDDDDGRIVPKKALPSAASPAAASAGPSAGPSAAAAPASASERLLDAATPLERCAAAVDFLAELDIYGWFAEPVTEEVAPGYSEYVEEPMDFSAIRGKLRDGAYADALPFADDVRLLYCNAITCVPSLTRPSRTAPATPATPATRAALAAAPVCCPGLRAAASLRCMSSRPDCPPRTRPQPKTL